MPTVAEFFNKVRDVTTINRDSLGLHRLPHYETLQYWRYGDVLFSLVLFVVYSFTYYIEPFQRQFMLSDVTIQHPYAERERVNGSELFLYATWLPALTLLVGGIFLTAPKYKFYVTYISLLGLLISVTLTLTVTDILKNFIGRCRPDFLARCIPKEGTPTDILVFAKDVCTTTNKEKLLDGFRTTPSGHSSILFAGLGYLLLWFSGQFVVFSNNNLGAWRSVLALIPILGAALIAISRTEDYRHHFVDVIIGSTLGSLVAWWSYRRFFPALLSPNSYLPKLVEIKEKVETEDYERLNEIEV